MRHRKTGRKLGRNASHRHAMFRNMANSFFEHEWIRTTVAKAKELRPMVERIITLARRDTLHARRLVMARLGNHRLDSDEYPTVVHKLFENVGPRFADRPGGYTRIIKLSERRLGDAGPVAMLALVDVDTTKRGGKAVEATK
jgi:large subunit ribosomal protein L17